MKKRVTQYVKTAVTAVARARGLDGAGLPEIGIELPREKTFGDFSSNIAMQLAGNWRDNPRAIGAELKSELEKEAGLAKVTIDGPGFINMTLNVSSWHQRLLDILDQKDGFAKLDYGAGQRVLVEFVSANPTGPLHIGHGRGAAVGDVLARILRRAGFVVDREYYVNDAGNQMMVLGRSLRWRYLELLGYRQGEIPDGYYRGGYLVDMAKALRGDQGDLLVAANIDEEDDTGLELFTRTAADAILLGIRGDLNLFGVDFEYWTSEKEFFTSGKVDLALSDLKEKDVLYEDEGATWFASSRFGDEKDRVVVRANGVKTYFASDIAYHREKYERGYDLLVDIWGADHHGYVPRLKAAIEALGNKPDSFAAILVQLVSLSRSGAPVAMSTRAGEFITLEEVVKEVGKDAARYFFLTRRSDSQLEFDLELAKSQNSDNPVYYAQYAHARICSIFRKIENEGLEVADNTAAPGASLTLSEELDLIKKLDDFPIVLESAARTLEPHRVTYYLDGLAAQLHSYYNRNRIIQEDGKVSGDRLLLIAAIRQVLNICLTLLGVSAPEKM
ncbi:MAG: arginine--tRNA ligase [Deltaproteobacteria bacterium]|nr:MAG: arginine--tRNA ligase [Deltaproteobacteria bacterium]